MGTIQDQQSQLPTSEEQQHVPPPNEPEINPDVPNDNILKVTSESPDNNQNIVTAVASGDDGGDVKTSDPKNSSPTDGGGEGSGVPAVLKSGTVVQKSGIPALSRIARPCTGQVKPAVPPTPPKNACDDTLRNLTDDYGKHRLTDVQEENEEETLVPSLSSRRLGSMDALWDTYSHRLSEAGLCRHSDNSVLTEDTDSFIIGDRVWVGGSKPGQIAYIGETQFAPGEWAGIALDQPIGKNDGSVGGTRYFQCESKRGVFSRLTRLTRIPLAGADDSSIYSSSFSVTSTPVNNGVRRRVGSPLSPTGSTRSLRKSPPSLSTSNTSLASTTHHVIDFKVGDRVIIKSSQGSKVGTLRYMGTADFAAGEWCGVELDEPRGKNDGSVEGRRYFECRPQFGLFAPVTKVSRSPMKYKPGNCVIHSGAGLPPTGIMKRAGSKESMTSMTSSLASAASGARRVRLGVNSLTPQRVSPKTPTVSFPTRTALQDVLREKQLHIEQLLKERDLERSEVTRAASQADEAEQKLTTLRSEYEHYRSECESKLQEYSGLLSQLNVDRGAILSQLDDEKRRNEDLQFRFEEAAITKGDIEVTNETNIHRIKELEEQLAAERQRAEALESDSSKLFEAEEALVKTREEVDILKNELQHSISKRSALEGEQVTSSESLTSLKQQLEVTQKQLEDTRAESTKTIEQLQSDLSKSSESSQATRSTFDKELDEYQRRVQQNEDNCKKQDDEIAALKAELAQTKALLEEKTIALDKKISESDELENSLKTELERSKRELSAKTVDLENNTDVLKTQEREIRSLKTQLETTELDLKSKVLDVERYQGGLQEAESSYKNEVEQLRSELKTTIAEKEEQEKQSAIAVSQRDTKLADANKTISQYSADIEKLKIDLAEAKESLERTSTEIHDRHARQIEARELQLMAMAAEIQQKNEEITKCSIVTTKLEDDICTKNGIIEKSRLELESFKRRFESEQLSISRYNEQINVLQLGNGDLQRKLSAAEQRITELSEQKLRLEQEMQTLMSSSGDYSAKLQQLSVEIMEKNRLVETVRTEFVEKLQQSQRIEQQLNIELQKVREDSQRAKVDFEEKLKMALEAESMLRQRCETANAETSKIRDDLMLRVTELQRLLEQKDYALKKNIDECGDSEQLLKEQLGRATAELQKTIESCQKRIDSLTVENIEAKNIVAQKSELIIETEAKLKHFVMESQHNEMEIRRTCDEQIRKIEFQLAEKNAQWQQSTSETELLQRDCAGQNVNIAEKDHKIAELINELQNTQLLVTQMQNERDKLQLMQAQTTKECSATNQQCNDLLNQVAVLSGKSELADKLAQDLHVQKTVYSQLFEHLQITERQKQNLIARLEDAVNKNGEADKCYYMLELAKNLQATTSDEQTKKILELQQIVEVNQQKLQECGNQMQGQKTEILRLQEALIKAQEVCETQGPVPQNSVSFVHGPTQNTPLHIQPQFLNPLQNARLLEIQLTTVRNNFAALIQRFITSQRVNVYLLNQLQTAVDRGDKIRIQMLLRELTRLKEYFNAFKNTIEADKFKLLRAISYATLSLQQKHLTINVLTTQIKQLQNNYNNLPLQCKLAPHVMPQPNNLFENPLNGVQIELDKAQELLELKETHIRNLQNQLVSFQLNLKAACPFKSDVPIIKPCDSGGTLPSQPSIIADNTQPPIQGDNQLRPSLQCPASKIIIKEVPVFPRKPPQSCRQVFPQYISNRPSNQNAPNVIGPNRRLPCTPGNVIIRRIPVLIPQIPKTIIKEIPVPMIPGSKCPSPRVVIQRVPILYPPKVVVKEIPILQPPKLVIKEVLVPIIHGRRCPSPQVIIQKVPVIQPPRVIFKELPIPQPPQIIIKQVPVPLPPRVIVKEVPVPSISGTQCPSPQVIEKEIPVIQPPKTIVKVVSVPQPPRIIEVPRPSRPCLPFISPSMQPNVITPSLGVLQQFKNQINYLKQQIQNLLLHPKIIIKEMPIGSWNIPSTPASFMVGSTSSPNFNTPLLQLLQKQTVVINYLKQKIQNLVLHSIVPFRQPSMYPVSQTPLGGSISSPNYAPYLMLIGRLRNQINYLRQEIQNLLLQPRPGTNEVPLVQPTIYPTPQLPIMGPTASPSNAPYLILIRNLRNQINYLNQQIQNLWSRPAPQSPSVGPIVSPNNAPYLVLISKLRNQINYLTQQIQNLLLHPKVVINQVPIGPTNISPTPEYPLFGPTAPNVCPTPITPLVGPTGSAPYLLLITKQRNQINYLTQQIQNLLLHPKVVTKQVPIPQPNISPSPDYPLNGPTVAPNYAPYLLLIGKLRNQIQNLLLRPNQPNTYPTPQLPIIGPNVSPNNAPYLVLIGKLRNQINYLNQQIQNILLYPKVVVKEVPIVQPNIYPTPGSYVAGPAISPNYKPYLVIIGRLRNQINYLTVQIQNLLARPKVIIKEVPVLQPNLYPTPETPLIRPSLLPNNVPSLELIGKLRNQINYLTRQIQNLLLHPKVVFKEAQPNAYPIAGIPTVGPTALPNYTPYIVLIGNLRNQINYLTQQIRNLSLHPKVVIKEVPISQPNISPTPAYPIAGPPVSPNYMPYLVLIGKLRNQIQNLLLRPAAQTSVCSTPVIPLVGPTGAPATAPYLVLITKQRNQINYLNQQIQNLLLHPKVVIKQVPILQPNVSPTLEYPIIGPTPSPNIAPYLLLIGKLRNQIQNLLLRPNQLPLVQPNIYPTPQLPIIGPGTSPNKAPYLVLIGNLRNQINYLNQQIQNLSLRPKVVIKEVPMIQPNIYPTPGSSIASPSVSPNYKPYLVIIGRLRNQINYLTVQIQNLLSRPKVVIKEVPVPQPNIYPTPESQLIGPSLLPNNVASLELIARLRNQINYLTQQIQNLLLHPKVVFKEAQPNAYPIPGSTVPPNYARYLVLIGKLRNQINYLTVQIQNLLQHPKVVIKEVSIFQPNISPTPEYPIVGPTPSPNITPYMMLIAKLRNQINYLTQQIQNVLLHPKVVVKVIPAVQPNIYPTPLSPIVGPTVAPNYTPYLLLIGKLRNQIQNLLLRPNQVPVVQPNIYPTPQLPIVGPSPSPNNAPCLALIGRLRNQINYLNQQIQNLLLRPKVIIKEGPILQPNPSPQYPLTGPTVAPYLLLIGKLRNQIQNLLLRPGQAPVVQPNIYPTPQLPIIGPSVSPNNAPYLVLVGKLRNQINYLNQQIQNILLHPKVVVKEVPIVQPNIYPTPGSSIAGSAVSPNYTPYLVIIGRLRNQVNYLTVQIQNLLSRPKVIIKEVPVPQLNIYPTPESPLIGPSLLSNNVPSLELIGRLRNQISYLTQQIQNLLLHPKVVFKEAQPSAYPIPGIPTVGPAALPNYTPYIVLIGKLRNQINYLTQQIQNLSLHPKVVVKEVPTSQPNISPTPAYPIVSPPVSPNYMPYLVLIGKLRNQIQNLLLRPNQVPVVQPNIYPTPQLPIIGPGTSPNNAPYLVLIGGLRNQINYLNQQIQNLQLHPKVVIKEVPVPQPSPSPEYPIIGPTPSPSITPYLRLIGKLRNQIQNLLLHPKVIVKEVPVLQPNIYPTAESQLLGPTESPNYTPYIVLIRQLRNQINYLTQQTQNILLQSKLPVGPIIPESPSDISPLSPNYTPYLMLITKQGNQINYLKQQIQNLLLHPKVIVKEVPILQPNIYPTPESPTAGPVPYLALIVGLRNQINYLTLQIEHLLSHSKVTVPTIPESPLNSPNAPVLILLQKQKLLINYLKQQLQNISLHPKFIVQQRPTEQPNVYPTPGSPLGPSGPTGPFLYPNVNAPSLEIFEQQRTQINSLKQQIRNLLLYPNDVAKEVVLEQPNICPTPESPQKGYIQRPNIIIKEIPRPCPNLPTLIKPAACILPSQVVNGINVNGFSNLDVFNFKKELYNLLLQQLICSMSNYRKSATSNLLLENICSSSNYRLAMPIPPRIIIKQVPVMQPPKTIIKEIPVPVGVGKQCPPPKILLHRIPVPSSPKIIVKEVPVQLPPRTIIKQIPIPIINGVKCPGPKILLQKVSVPIYQPPRTILKEVPIPQPPRIIIKEVIVPQPSRPIIKYVPVPLRPGSKCPIPQVIVQKVPIMQPPRIIVKEVPLPQPPRVIIKEVAVQQPPRVIIKEVPKIIIKEMPAPACQPCSGSQISPGVVPPFLPPKIIIKEIPVPIGRGQQCPPPKVILQRVPVPSLPKVVVKTVGTVLPPKIIVKQIPVPVIHGTQCPPPKILVQRVPVLQPPKTVIKELLIPQPPRIVVKEVPVPQPPRVIVKYIPSPVVPGVKCPVPNVFIQKVPVLQPPRIIVKEVPVRGPPRIVIKEVSVPQPARIVVKEVLVPQPPKIIFKQIPQPPRKIFIRVPVSQPPIIRRVPMPIVQPPRIIMKPVPIPQPPRIIVKEVRIPQPPRIVIQKVPVPIVQPAKTIIKVVRIPQPPRIIVKEIPIFQPTRTIVKEVPIPQPPRIIIKQVPIPQPPIIRKIPVYIRQPSRTIIKEVPIPQPPRIIIKQVPVPQPPRILIKNVPVPILQPARSIIKEVPIPQPPRTIFIRVPVSQPPIIKKIPMPVVQPPRIIIKPMPIPQPPRVIVKEVPISQPPRIVIQKVPVPILQPAKTIIKVVRIPQPPRTIVKEVPIFQPTRTIIKEVPIPQPPRIIIKQVPIPQPAVIRKIPIYIRQPSRTIIKKVLIPQPPRIVIQRVPVPIVQPARTIIKVVRIPQPPKTIIKEVPIFQPTRTIVKEVPIPQPPRIIIKQVSIPQPAVIRKIPVYIRQPSRTIIKEVPISQPPRIIIKQVPVPQPPRILIKNVPVPILQPAKTIIKVVRIPQPPRTIIKEVPILQPTRTIIKEVPIPQPPRIIIKQVPIPQPALIRKIPVYIRQPSRTIIKEVPIPQPPRIIVKNVPVPIPQPPRVIVKEVPIPQPPRIVIQRVPVPIVQPPKTIIKVVRIPQPPRIVVKEVPIFQPIRTVIKEVQIPQPPRIIIKQVPIPQPPLIRKIPVYIRQPSKTIIKEVPIPQPPRIIVKNVPVPIPQPPRVIVKEVLIPQPPRIVIQRVPVPIVQPAKTIIKVVRIPQPPRIVVKEVPIFQPIRTVIKEVPIPQPPRIIIKQVPVPQPAVIRKIPVYIRQPSRTIIKEVPIPQPPRIIVKNVPVPIPQPPRVIVKEVPIPQPSRIVIQRVPVPIVQPAKTIIKVVRIPQPPRIVVKEVPIFQPIRTVIKEVPIPQPPRIIIKQVPVPQPAVIRKIPVYIRQPSRIIIKEVPVPQPPRTIFIRVPVSQPSIIRRIPVPIVQPPRIIIKQVSIPQPPRIIVKEVPIPQPPRIIIQRVPVPISQPAKTIIKVVRIPQPPRTIVKEVPIFQPTRTTVKEVLIPQPPRIIIKQVPIPQPAVIRKIPVYIRQPSRTIIKEVPIPQPPRTILIRVPVSQPPIIRRVPVPIVQPPRIIIKQVSIPQRPRIVVKEVPIPQPPRIIIQRVPVPISQPAKTIIKVVRIPQEVPVPQPPRTIFIRVPVSQPPIIRRIPVPIVQPPRIIIKQVPIPQPPRIVVKEVPIPQPPRIIIQRVPVPIAQPAKTVIKVMRIPQPPRIIVKEIPIFQPSRAMVKEVPIPQPPRIIIKQVPIPQPPIIRRIPVVIRQPPRTIIKEVSVPQPPRIIIKQVPIPQPPRIIFKQVPIRLPPIIRKVPMPILQPPRVIIKQVLVQQPPRTIIKEVSIPQQPRIIIRNIPVPIPQPPRVIVKEVPISQRPRVIVQKVFVRTPCGPPRMIVKEICADRQPPRIIVKPVPVPAPYIPQPCPVPVPPKTIIKELPVPIGGPCKAPKIIILQVPVPQQPKIIEKIVPVPLPPRIIVKPIPVPVIHGQVCPAPKVVIQRVPVLQPPRTILKEVPIPQPPRIIIKEVPVSQPPRVIIKTIPIPIIRGVTCPTPRVIFQRIPVVQPPRTIVKEVSVPQPPRIIVKQVPISIPYESRSSSFYIQQLKTQLYILREELQRTKVESQKIIIKEVPVPVPISKECNVPKIIIQRVPVPQAPKVYVKSVPVLLPPRIIIKQIPVPIIHGTTCPPPKIITQRVPILQPPRTIIKEVPIPQPPRIVIKEVPISQPPNVIIKQVPIPIANNMKCPPPRVILQRVPILQPPRTIIKEIPIPQQPRIIVKEVPVTQPPRVILKEVPIYGPCKPQPCPTPIIPFPSFRPSKTIIKEVVIPTGPAGLPCKAPKLLIHYIPVSQPPRIIVKTVPVPLPPKIIIRQVPVPMIHGASCPPPKILVQRVPILQPPRTVLKEVPIPQPPQIIIKQVQVPQPARVIFKQVPVPIIKGIKCPAPRVVIQKVPVMQPPQTIIKEVPVQQPPRIILKEVLISQPPRIIVKEVPVPMPYAPPNNLRQRQLLVQLQVIRETLERTKAYYENKLIAISQHPRIIFQRIPVLQKPKIIDKEVVVPQPPRIIVKEIPGVCPPPIIPPPRIKIVPVFLPPKTIIKEIPIPVRSDSQCNIPKLIIHRVPVPQAPKIIVKTVPVPLPPKIIIKQIPVPIIHGASCPPPKVIIQRIPVLQPPRTILKEVPIPQPPRIIIKQIPVPQPQQPIIKYIRIPVSPTIKCPIPRVVIQKVPVVQPPRVIIKEVPVPQPPRIIVQEGRVTQQPRFIIKEVPMLQPCPTPNIPAQPPRVIIKQVPVPIIAGTKCPAPRVILQRIPVVQPPRTLIKEIRVTQPPRIIVKQVPVRQRPRIIVKEVPVPAPYRPQPCPAPDRPFSNIKIIPILQPPKTILKEILVPIGSGARNVPKIIIHRVPLPLPPKIVVKTVPVPMPPKVIFKLIPVPVIRGTTCPAPKILIQRIPVLQPPRTILKEVPIAQPPQIVVKEVPIPQPPRVVVKHVPVPVFQGVKCPSPRVIIQRVPVSQPPRTIIKELPVPQPPRVIVKLLPQQPRLIVKEVPKIIIKEVPVPSSYLPQPSSDSLIRPSLPNLIIPEGVSPNEFIKNLYLEGFSSSQTFRFKQQLLNLLLQSCPNVAPPPYPNIVPTPYPNIAGTPYPNIVPTPYPNIVPTLYPSPPSSQICPQLPNLEIPNGASPNDFIRNMPLLGYTPLQIFTFKQQLLKLLIQQSQSSITLPASGIKIKDIPVPTPCPSRTHPNSQLYLPLPSIELPKGVAPGDFVNNLPLTGFRPLDTFRFKQQLLNLLLQRSQCASPNIINKFVPLPQPIRTVVKEIPVPVIAGRSCPPPKLIIHPVQVPQNPKVIVKQIPVTLPPRIIVRVIRVPIIQGVTCPPPRVINQPVPVISPPRIIIKEVPIQQPPRIIIKEVPVPQPPRVVVKQVPVPIIQGTQCPPPRTLIQKVVVPQPPRIIIKEVPIAQPPRIIVKEVVVPQPPKLIIKEVAIPQPPRVIVKNVPVFVSNNNYPRPGNLVRPAGCVSAIVHRNSLSTIEKQRTEINNLKLGLCGNRGIVYPTNYPSVPILKPSPNYDLLPTETPGELQEALHIQENVIRYQKTEIYRLEQEVQRLLGKVSACSSYLSGSGSSFPGVSRPGNPLIDGAQGYISPVPLRGQCIAQLRKQRTLIQSLTYRIKQLLRSGSTCKQDFANVSNNNRPFAKPPTLLKPTLPLIKPSPVPNIPLPLMHVLKSITPSVSYPLIQPVLPSASPGGLQTSFVKAMHAAFSHTQQALTHCMNAVLIQQLAFNQSQINNNVVCSDHQQLLEQKQIAEGQVQFLNTIIVDMQRKNEEQRSRIEILESGYSPAAADELKLYGLPHGSIPPRVYCDICEEFDKHETEECPLQATDDDPAPCSHPRAKKEAQLERPYCEICEVFGHCTEECKDDQTF